jgi:hypothetical protein
MSPESYVDLYSSDNQNCIKKVQRTLMEGNKMTEWQNELNSLSKGTDFLRLEAGEHKVMFLDEGKPCVVEYEGKEMEKVFFRVRYEGQEYTWSITKGSTINGLWGQICTCGAYGGGLTGKTLTILVKGSGRNKDYTVMEALSYQSEIEKVNGEGGK